MAQETQNQTAVVNPQNYEAVVNGVATNDIPSETYEKLKTSAKQLKNLKVGMQAVETIEYLSLSDMKDGEEVNLIFLRPIKEKSINEDTGEVKTLDTMIFINGDGNEVKNSTTIMVQHFATKPLGYAARVIYRGKKRTKKGNSIDNVKIYPLFL